jgi:Leucine-rich repeat (LRR) protein
MMSLTDPDALKIDESHPLLHAPGCGWKKVWFVNSGRFVDKENIIALLERLNLDTVKTIYISNWSYMDTLWVLPFFKNATSVITNSLNIKRINEIADAKNLKRLVLYCPNLIEGALGPIEGLALESLTVLKATQEDISSIKKHLSLKDLQVIGWPESDLTSLSNLRLESLRVQESKALVSVAGLEAMRMGVAEFLWCKELSSLEYLDCSRLEIVSCKKIKLDSLAIIKRLEYLNISQNGTVDCERFLTECQGLKTLSVAASKIANLSSKSFPTKKCSLKAVYLCLTNKTLKLIAPALPSDIAIGNGKLYFKSGTECSKEYFYDLIFEGNMKVRYYQTE